MFIVFASLCQTPHLSDLLKYRCLILLEDLDSDEDGALGNVGKEIQLCRYEQLFYNSWGTKQR